VGSDNTAFVCKSCGDCNSAANQIASWCNTGGTNGATTSGTNGATNGSINGSTTSATNGATNGSTTGGPTGCDVPTQNCGAGMKCVAMADTASQMLVGTCVTDGTVAAGGACTPQTGTNVLNDNCRAGFVCDNLFGNFSNVCRKICSHNSDCGAGQHCGDFLFAGAGWGWCAPTCTPFSSAAGNCAAGMDCGETDDDAEQPDPNSEAGFFLCKVTGTGKVYSTCTKDPDCGANLWCGIVDQTSGAAACLPNCNDTTVCVSLPGDAGVTGMAMCHPLTGQPANAGYCIVQ
jgi:hypothetical protein